MTVERITRIETQVQHIGKIVDELRDTQLTIVAAMNEAKGAARASKAIGHSITALVAFGVSQLSGFIHLK
jgi:hypothetical protein